MHEDQWRRTQRRDGYADGLSGRGDRGYSDQYYQKGLREGTARRKDDEFRGTCYLSRTEDDHLTACPYRATFEARHERVDGDSMLVCGIHAKVLARCRYTVRRLA